MTDEPNAVHPADEEANASGRTIPEWLLEVPLEAAFSVDVLLQPRRQRAYTDRDRAMHQFQAHGLLQESHLVQVRARLVADFDPVHGLVWLLKLDDALEITG